MAPLGTEKTAVQRPLLRYAEEAGWTHLPPAEVLRLGPGEASPVLHSVFVGQRQRLSPGVVDHGRAEEVAKRLVRVEPKEVHPRPLARKWASCSAKGRLTCYAEQLHQLTAFRRAVIARELLHLKAPNHRPLFRSLLRAYLAEAAR